ILDSPVVFSSSETQGRQSGAATWHPEERPYLYSPLRSDGRSRHRLQITSLMVDHVTDGTFFFTFIFSLFLLSVLFYLLQTRKFWMNVSGKQKRHTHTHTHHYTLQTQHTNTHTHTPLHTPNT